ncbi:methyltransferase [Mangrovimicrobium sediminis]|uniref:Methyltransferase n=1 Tax=Mangrovimicrobium sediminis TaxID=2562682 RepID=A0A4Z0M0I0_9GAMM|nr:CmcJ/NvfI family oxidoreductase [Haliea sp. SAOS-164]TGD73041.1 methyltransferase [Haliea sp. SAOS-164]
MASKDTQARLRYLVPGPERPVYYASQAGADAALNVTARFEDREVAVRDARALRPLPSLAREGFCLRAQHTAVDDFYALEPQRERYEVELTELVLAATGAESALVFDHTLRSDSAAVRGARTTRETASLIHNDYTAASAAKRVRDRLTAEQAAARLQRRFAIVNAWRSVAGVIWHSPLACCDGRSLAESDLVPSERRAAERVGELELVTWNPAHRWYYFPEMRPDEVLLIKTWDSDPGEGAARAVHTAFDNPLAPADAPPRESIESRLLVFFA